LPPYPDAATLIDKIFDEVERVLLGRGIPFEVIEENAGELP